jgi:hypothetical protein
MFAYSIFSVQGDSWSRRIGTLIKYATLQLYYALLYAYKEYLLVLLLIKTYEILLVTLDIHVTRHLFLAWKQHIITTWGTRFEINALLKCSSSWTCERASVAVNTPSLPLCTVLNSGPRHLTSCMKSLFLRLYIALCVRIVN